MPKGFNRHVLIEITKRCNLNCRHCFTSAGKKVKNEMTSEQWKLIAKDLVEFGFNAFTISGGEPLLEPEKTFALAKDLKYYDPKSKVYLFTNGWLIDKQMIKKFKGLFCGVMLSLDGNRKNHDWLRRKNGSYDKVVDAIGMLNKAQIPVSIQSMVTGRSKNDIRGVVKFAQENQIRAIRFSHVDLFGRAREFEDELKPNNNLLRKIHKEVDTLSKVSKVYLTTNLVNFDDFVAKPAVFRVPSLHILADGWVLPWYGFPKSFSLLKYTEESWKNINTKKLNKKLLKYINILKKSEGQVLKEKRKIFDYDNIIAGYLFKTKEVSNGKM